MASEKVLYPHDEEKVSQNKRMSTDVVDTEKVDQSHVHDTHDTGPIKGDLSDGRVDWTRKQILATISLCGLYVGEWSVLPISLTMLTHKPGSQIGLYFSGGALSYIAVDVGGEENASWIPVSYGLVFSAISPFCGYLQDIFGRRNITLAGGCVVIIGNILMSTSHSFIQAIVGMAMTGAGASIGELTALAG